MVQRLHGMAKEDDLRAEMLDVVDLDEGRWMRLQHPRDEVRVEPVEAGMRKVPDA
jgi:hypothetical protein